MKHEKAISHSFWIFWIGLLTGALLVGLLFSYQSIQRQNLQDALLKSGYKITTSTENSIVWPDNN